MALVPRWIRTPRSSHERRPLVSVAMPQEHATVAEEEYLQIMFWLEEAGLPITGANIARAMQLSAPTVHEMIGRLERDGYVEPRDDKSLAFTADGRDHAAGDRSSPPADRALPHRRPRDSLGRGPRGGRAARARDVAGARGAHAGGDRRREDLPARPPARRGSARARARCWPTSRPGADVSTSCGSRTRPRSSCTTSSRPGCTRASTGRWRAPATTRSSCTPTTAAHVVSRSVAETVSVRADPSPQPRAPLPEQLVLSSDRYGR